MGEDPNIVLNQAVLLVVVAISFLLLHEVNILALIMILLRSIGLFLITALLLSARCFAQTSDHQALIKDKLWLIEQYPPYHYEEGQVNKGIMIDILVEAFARNKLNFDAQQHVAVFPWARAVRELAINPNAVVISMGFTEERNSLFRLSTPLIHESIDLIAMKKSQFQISEPGELSQYVIGAVRDDIGERLLKDTLQGHLNIVYVQTSEELVQMLVKGRVDMLAYSRHIVDYQIVKLGLNIEDFPTLKILGNVPATIAFNRQGDTQLFLLLNEEIEKMHEEGAVSRIVQNYKY